MFLCVYMRGSGCRSCNYLQQNCSTAGVESAPKSSIMINYVKRGNPIPAPSGRLTVRHAVVGLEKDVERSECSSVMDEILVAISPAQ